MQRDLQDQAVIVTGASRGIGRAIAHRLAGLGMRLGLLARDAGRLESTAAEIEVATGAVVFTEACDLADLDALPGGLRSLAGRLGRVDVLVNNAGVFLESEVAQTTTAAWQSVLDVNLTAAFVCCRELVPRLIASTGRIVNIASTAGSQGYLRQAAYCASKHGMIGFSKALALELKPHGIHVACLSPGGVETDFIRGTELGARLEGQAKIRPGDVADFVAHLLQAPDNVEIPEIVLRRFSPS